MMRAKNKILVVDEDQIIYRTLYVMLRKSGYDVFIVQNGVEAQRQLKEKIFNVIILEEKLPDISGLELLRIIRKKYPEIMVIIVTAYASIESSIEAMSKGAFSYIIKPYEMSKIKEVVLQAIKEQKYLLKNKNLVKDLKKENIELKKTKEELLQLVKIFVADQVISEVSHKIKSPLTVIGSAAYFIEEALSLTNGGVLKNIEMIKRGVEQIGKSMEKLLNITRPLEVNLKPYSINKIIEDILQKRQYLPKDVKIRSLLKADLPKALIDVNKFQEMFINLLSNAFEAMPDGGELKIISTESRDKKDVEILIEDTGRGIPPDDIPKLFDPFFTTKPKGMGLGLTISHKIIAAHKGNIEVRSKVGKGTSFIIRLPVAN